MRLYRYFFARKCFFGFHRALYNLSLRGLGVLNYENDRISGEKTFLTWYLGAKQGSVVLDIGANVGNYAIQVLRIQPTARVYAFEPHPLTYDRLRETSIKFGFQAFNVGCGSRNCELPIYDYQDSNGSEHASLYKEVFSDLISGKDLSENRAKIVRLDDFSLTQDWTTIDLLKVDVEGNELDVLNGFGNFLKGGKIRAIHFEFNSMNVISRVFFKDFFDLLGEYAFHRLLPDGLVRIPRYDPVLCEIFAFQNIVALHGKEGSGGDSLPRNYRNGVRA